MVMQIQAQIGDTRRVFLWIRLEVLRIQKNFILREIPKTRSMDFGLLYENDKGEYVVLNNVRMADKRLASLVYLLVYASAYCVPIALLRQNKPFRWHYLLKFSDVKILDVLFRAFNFRTLFVSFRTYFGPKFRTLCWNTA